ncbi:MAG: hypothetical protein JWO89_3789 [Verrucomicrobiaceae bacterium]|nr:hypothetical protein [Verrucomicrobiaceae bacterium]
MFLQDHLNTEQGMKPIVEKPSPIAATEPVVCEVVRGTDFGCVWHYHPEFEITLIVRGGTQRLVCNKLSALVPGDLVFLGPNLPHDFHNQPAPGRQPSPVEAIVVQFQPQFPGVDWRHLTSMLAIQRLFQRAEHGLKVTGDTREAAARMMEQMLLVHGIKRLILLLQLLDLLASSEDLQEICPSFPLRIKSGSPDRIGKACEYIVAHFAEALYVPDLAMMVGMSKSAFSRLFKKSTGRTVPQHVNELRVAHACCLLTETDMTVNQIAADCGFVSLAHFQRQFREHKQCAPLAYRGQLSQSP